jgi:hypothetical protein
VTNAQGRQGQTTTTCAVEIASHGGRFFTAILPSTLAAIALLTALLFQPVGQAHGVRPVTDKKAAGGALNRWSGYAVLGSFRSVTGSWTVPAASCPIGSTSSSTAWIGLDGANSNHVEQTGTDSACSKGTPYYYAWVELYGTTYNSGKPLVSCGVVDATACIPYAVTAGDKLLASIEVKDSVWNFLLTDTTAGWSYTTSVAHPVLASGHGGPAANTAEWIVENDGTALTNFGHLTMTDAMVNHGGHVETGSSYPLHRFTASGVHGTSLAAAGTFHRNGSFTDTWHHSV